MDRITVNSDSSFGYDPFFGAYPYDTFRETQVWHSSPTVNGKLVLCAQPFSLERLTTKKMLVRSPSYNEPPPVAIDAAHLKNHVNVWSVKNAFNQTQSESYARFRGKLYKGAAALGVTFGSYSQSKDMIVQRFSQLNRNVDEVLASFPNGVKNMTPKRIASLHLEVIFGWTPLLADIHAAAMTAAQAFPPEFVTARARKTGYIARSMLYPDVPTEVHWACMSTRSAKVRVINPNLWLGERLGLLNFGAVAWDLVPWSFVVNMFVNTSQQVSSLTDYAGLEFSDASHTTTRTLFGVGTQTRKGAYCTSNMTVKLKSRSLSVVERPPLALKLPGVDAGLIAMSASLFIQKFRKLS